MDLFLEAAIKEALKSQQSGGIPIGSVLIVENKIIGRGHNQRIQKNNPILHAEMDCLANAGRLKADIYKKAILYTTLSPCDMCSGAILLYGIPEVIIGENHTFCGAEKHLISRGVKISIINDSKCIKIMKNFIHNFPELWNEDIGV